MKALELFERLAVIVTALFVGWQTWTIAGHTKIFADLAGTAVKHYEGSLAAATTDRSSVWAAKLRENDTWGRLVTVNKYLRQEADEGKKIKRLQSDARFREDFFFLLAMFEDLAYLYNTNKIDREFIKRSPSGAIIEFYDNSLFWIESSRRLKKSKELAKEFESMVRDIRPTGATGSVQ